LPASKVRDGNAEPAVAADGAGITAFRGIQILQPPRRWTGRSALARGPNPMP